MDTNGHEWESDLTEVVIGAAFEVATNSALVSWKRSTNEL